jgi:hypothetical protein
MNINWGLVVQIAGPIFTLFVGVWINRWLESRPRLISYFGHVSSFQLHPPGGIAVLVHAHAVILRNVGRRSAKNVRLSHLVLPDFKIWPPVVHQVENLPDGNREIIIPTIVPNQELTISYLYLPPLTAAQVNLGVWSDEGFAQQIPVALQRQYPKWFNLTAGILFIVGIVASIYVFIEGMIRVWQHL